MDKPSRQYLEELNHCIDENDAVKGCALMPFFAEMPEEVRHLALKKLFLSMEAPGLPILTFLCRHLKKQKKPMDLEWLINRLLTPASFGPEDENRLAFWADAMAEMGLLQAIPRLLDLVATSRSETVMAAASCSLLRLDSEDGARLLQGLCEEEPLRGSHIAETLPLAGKIGFFGVAGLLTSTHHGLRNLAIDIFAAAGPHGVDALAIHLEEADVDSAIHAINALGRSGSSQALPPLLNRLSRAHDVDNIRYAIFEAAGRLPSPKWALHLARGLADPSEQVRMAAARAVDRNISGALISGISNIISFGDDTAEKVVGSLIDARVENTLGMILNTAQFQKLAQDHLIYRAHPEVRETCLLFFEKKGADALVARVRKAIGSAQAGDHSPTIMCVDDSKMILLLYMKSLNALDFEAVVFEEPEKALAMLDEVSPDLVITDLNMPVMDGFTLAGNIKKQRPDLPILLVTTQSDAEIPGGDAAPSVDGILHKPFTTDALKEAMAPLFVMEHAIDF